MEDTHRFIIWKPDTMARPHGKQSPYPISRLRHTQLQPLFTKGLSQTHRHAVPVSHYYPRSASMSAPQSIIHSSPIVSIGGRYYYHENGPMTNIHPAHFARSPSIATAMTPQNTPRRHSVIISPGGLTNRLEAFNLASPLTFDSQTTTDPDRVSSAHRKSIAAESREMLLKGVKGSELARLGTVVSRNCRSSIIDSNLASHQISADWTLDTLRQWGHIYLGNVATADIFVKALQLPQSSINTESQAHVQNARRESTSSENATNTTQSIPTATQGKTLPLHRTDYVVIKAKVTPRAKERKPFVIQRRFNLQELRTGVGGGGISLRTTKTEPERDKSSDESSQNEATDPDPDIIITHERSKSRPSPRDTERHNWEELRRSSITTTTTVTSIRSHNASGGSRRFMPIHIEYALHHLPVLGALMLSGHIRKGDTVELPLPHPEAWRDSVAYVYTGQGEVTEPMRRNIMYLAGHID